ncbi:MAG TPA: hypothetical protein VGQ83_21295 [Polyangia bacterium]|jgi:hypothetical protein
MRKLRCAAFLATALALGGCSCGAARAVPDGGAGDAAAADRWTPDARDAPVFEARCIGDWPADPGATPQPSLATSAKQVLWRRTLPWVGYRTEIALGGDHIALVGGNKLWILDLAGNVTGEMLDGTSLRGNGPLADAEGNFLFVTTSAYSVTPAGTVRWKTPLVQGYAPDTIPSSAALSPAGILYVATSAGTLFALRASDGYIVWRRGVGGDPQNSAAPVTVGPGIGDTVFVGGAPYAAPTGEPAARLSVDGTLVAPGAASYSGIIEAGYAELVGERYQWRLYQLDPCGRLLREWPPDGGWSPYYFIGFSDNLVLGSDQGGHNTYVYSSAGERLLGPAPWRGVGLALGADGAMYAAECNGGQSLDTQSMSLIAYAPSLAETWSLDLGVPCTAGGVVLADNGMLITARELPNGIEVIAVQTASPGLARTSYPTHGFNNRRTNWLGP